MKTKELLATLESLAAIHEARGAADQAAALRSFKNAIEPLAAADTSLLVAALSRGRAVDNKTK